MIKYSHEEVSLMANAINDTIIRTLDKKYINSYVCNVGSCIVIQVKFKHDIVKRWYTEGKFKLTISLYNKEIGINYNFQDMYTSGFSDLEEICDLVNEGLQIMFNRSSNSVNS